jgi:hypothetical protein
MTACALLTLPSVDQTNVQSTNCRQRDEEPLMTTEEITLRVSPEAARAFRSATPQEQLKLEALVSFQLLGYLQPRRSLDTIISDLSQQAQERGLTPELLEEILRDNA